MHRARPPAAGRSVFALGAGCGTLAVAAMVSAVNPVVPRPASFADRLARRIGQHVRFLEQHMPTGRGG